MSFNGGNPPSGQGPLRALWFFSLLNPVSLDCFLQLLRQRSEVNCRLFELAPAPGRLLAGLPDIAHGLHHLREANLLLVGTRDNLLERLHALLDAAAHLAN